MIPPPSFQILVYDVRKDKDWTQYTDVAAQNPDKVREMTDLMFGEFAKYQVLPLMGLGGDAPGGAAPLSLIAGRKVFTYSGEPISGIP